MLYRRVPAHSIARSREPLKPMKPSSAARRRGPPLQRWLTFLRTHAPNIADMDLFVVPSPTWTCSWFRPLASTCSTSWSSCGWGALDQRHTESNCGVDPHTRSRRHSALPDRDRDQACRAVVTRRLRTMGIRDKPIAPGSPWQTGFAGKVDRINPARVRGPHRRAGRGALVHAR